MRFVILQRLAIILLFTMCSFLSFGEKITVKEGAENKFSVLESNPLTLVTENLVGEITTLEVSSGTDLYIKLMMPGYSKTQDIGSPELPVMRKLIEVPVTATFKIEILESSYTDISLADLGYLPAIMPVQPPVPKNGAMPDFRIDQHAYSNNAFYPEELVTAENLGTLRCINLGRLDIFPVQYNPVTHTLRVYDRIKVKVTFLNGDLAATAENKARYENPYFKSISRSVINYQPLASRDTIVKYPITYVIIADPMFEAQLQPLIEWKTKKGFHVIEAYTNMPEVGGTTSSIKSYIQELYTNPPQGVEPPSFVLFAGDIAQIPAWTGQAAGHVTDLYYCEYTNDNFPEIYYGRFSAQVTSQLQPQIDKTLMYEQYTMPDPAYLGEVVMVAGMDGTFGPIHANGQILYGTENYFNATNNIFSHTYLYPGSGANAANIRQDISNGVCYANYTAHGSENGWADPTFNTGHISQMTNDGKYALLVGNACLTSSYQVNECFGEALLRTPNKGSLGYIGASNNTYWDEDYYWGVGVGPISGDPPTYGETSLGAYDRTFHTHGEPRDEWYATMDQMVFAGNLAVTEGSPGSSQYYWEAYNLMGDPSLMVYYSVPPAMTVTYSPLMPLGSSSFTINTGEPFAYVAISFNGSLKGAVQADEIGVAEVPLIPILSAGYADIVVTSQNRQPFIGTVLVANPEGPFILLENISTTELSGNMNNKNESNEVIGLNVTLKNWGNTDGTDVTSTITTTDPYVTISDAVETVGTVPAQSSVTLSNAFSVIISPAIPNGHEVEFILVSEDPNRETWSSDFKILLSAPVVQCNSIAIDDLAGGNGNHRLDPGESASVVYTFANNGGVIATDVTASLLAHSGFISITDPVQVVGNIGLSGTTTVNFSLAVDNETPEGIAIDFEINLTSPNYAMSEIDPLKIGLFCEDFETGNLSKFPWITGGSLPWSITYLFPYEGNYCLRSGAITDNQTSEISLQYTSMSDDSISFYRKVSSQASDKLKFFIDGQLQEEWSGTTSGWRHAVYPVSGGTHTYKWVYMKDASGSYGSDAAWIDYISFPPPLASTIYAGQDEFVCETDLFQSQAAATNFNSLLWSTSGTGTFNNNAILQTIYTPSIDDLATGEVTLTLTMTDAGGASFADELLLTFAEIPGVPAMPSGPGAVNLASSYTSDYTIEPVVNASIFNWVVEPAEAGIMVSRGETGTIVWNREWTGTATIMAAATNQCGQSEPSPGFVVTVQNGTVGIPDATAETLTVKVYPNPAHGHLNIELNSTGASRTELKLVNLLGKSIYTQTTSGSRTMVIPLDNLAPGIYVLEARNGTNSRTVKIMVH